MRRMVHPLSTESASNVPHSSTMSDNGDDEDLVWKYMHHYSSIVTGFHSFIHSFSRMPSFILVR